MIPPELSTKAWDGDPDQTVVNGSPPLGQQGGQISSLGNERFQNLERIGAGGMGVVYRAFDSRENITVALKTIPRLEPAALARFKWEFRSMAGLAHPNLVQLFELFADTDRWFFTMEYVDGIDFLRYVRPSRESDPDRFRHATRQLVDAVAALHNAGRLHRDLKPANVLVTPEGRVVVLDFGLVANLEQRPFDYTVQEGISGTVGYMSPEQLLGETLTEASDWYAVGVMLHEAITGKRPQWARGAREDRQQGSSLDSTAISSQMPRDVVPLCRRLLSPLPADRPAREELLLYFGSSGDPPVDISRRADQSIFVGRENQLLSLRTAFERVTAGQTAVALIRGKSGFGKTTLLERFLEEIVRDRTAVILLGRCYETESVPYKAVDSMVDALNRYLAHFPREILATYVPRHLSSLARVFPVLEPLRVLTGSAPLPAHVTDQVTIRRQAFAAMRELLGNIGNRNHLVLAIDDAQWGDGESLALLHEVLRPPDAPPLLLVCTYREESQSQNDFVKGLHAFQFEGPGFFKTEQDVGPLNQHELSHLAEQLLSVVKRPGGSEVIIRESGGSPYFAKELANHWQGEAAASLDELLWRRVVALPDEARSLLEVVCVSNQPTRDEFVHQVAGFSPRNVKALALLRLSLLIKGSKSGDERNIEAYHDRIRETVLTRLDHSKLTNLHLRLAVTLESAKSGDFEQIAIHYDAAGERSRASTNYLYSARRAGAALAFSHAADLYARALALGDLTPQERGRLEREYADALANAGRSTEAGQVYGTAAENALGEDKFELERLSAHYFVTSGHLREGEGSFQRMLQHARLRAPRSATQALTAILWSRARLRLRGVRFRERRVDQIPPELLRKVDAAWSAATGLMMVDFIIGAAFISRSLLLALEAGEPSRIARSMTLEAATRVAMNRHDKSAQLLFDCSVNILSQLNDPYASGMHRLAQMFKAFAQRRWRETRQHGAEAERLFREECRGATWETWTVRNMILISLCGMGDPECPVVCERWMNDARERGDLFAQTTIGAFVMPLNKLVEDRPQEALRILNRSVEEWPGEGLHTQRLLGILGRIWIYLYEGHGRQAYDFICGQWPELQRRQILRMEVHRTALLFSRARSALAAARTADSKDSLLRAAEADVRSLFADDAMDAQAYAHMLSGCISLFRSDRQAALESLERATHQFEAAEMASCANAVIRARARLIGHQEGEALLRRTDEWNLASRLQQPDRMMTALLPMPEGMLWPQPN